MSSIDAFAIAIEDDWYTIPASYFDYSSDSAWIALKKTPEASAYINSMIAPGDETVIMNPVTNFHLGLISGGTTSGCKYGYLSDFAPKKAPMQSRDSLEIIISSKIFDNEWQLDEPLILKITDTLTNIVWYDTTAAVTKAYGFHDTIYVDSGIYKCEIIDMGANVEMPVIKVDDHIIPWGYPEYEYYLISIPGTYNTENIIWRTACDSLVAPSGKYTWYSEGTYFDTIPNAEGFDSLLTVNLNLHYSSSSILYDTACFNYISPAGVLLESSGIYHEIITNAAGCDSSLTINLTVKELDNTVETITNTMKVSEEGAAYQWLACASGLDIEGATGQLFTPVVSGLYAVRITKDECTVTSNCITITATDETLKELEPAFYPNPVTDELFIDLRGFFGTVELSIDDMAGRSVLVKNYTQPDIVKVDTRTFGKGIYSVRLKADGRYISFKIIK
ncbi:MAG TPA: T9SS type A sorting domain-containing protein, partial [Bacteroidales bacterium]|nr:T9SS type A sorting domain-containing protein [Bacteroidales bacterium]